jgi:hypothetical protein
MPMHEISTLIYCINTVDCKNETVSETESVKVLDTAENVRMEPSEAAIKNILDFARSFDVIETKSTGYVEMILN